MPEFDENEQAVETTEEAVATGVIEVSAKKEGFDEVTVTYDFGVNLDAMVASVGADVVFTNARANFKITLQGLIRRYLAAGKSGAEITEIVKGWKPGMQMERTVDPLGAARRAMSGMSDEDKQAFIDNLLAG